MNGGAYDPKTAALVSDVRPGPPMVFGLQGYRILVQPFRRGGDVVIPIDAETPIGRVKLTVEMSVETFREGVRLARAHNVVPQLEDLIASRTGQRLILPR